jgi:hypothetical protein
VLGFDPDRPDKAGELARQRGVLVCGETQDKAAQLARALAFRVLADQIEAGDVVAIAIAAVSFAA